MGLGLELGLVFRVSDKIYGSCSLLEFQMIHANTIRTIVRIICQISQMISSVA